MEIEEILNAFSMARTKSDVCRLLNKPINGSSYRWLDKIIKEHDVDISHFDRGGWNRKYPVSEKQCPVCGVPFKVSVGSPKEPTTCSRSCANTYFRSGSDNPNWSGDNYRSLCFLYHKKECVICKENLIVEVHHFNLDNSDNSPENLIPLCPTHHQYFHSKYAHMVEDKIKEYRELFIKSLAVLNNYGD